MKPLLLSLTCALLCSTQVVVAATTYRCSSNSFQDTPCPNYNHSKPLKTTVESATHTKRVSARAPYAVDRDCKQRGNTAKKIMWQREIGKTKDQQLETAQDKETQALISEVYNQQGSIVEVRNNIELACMQQKKQDKLTAQPLLATKKSKQSNS